MLPKSRTIDAIVKLNPTATPGFLMSFADDELARYLDRLTLRSIRKRSDPLDDVVLLDDGPTVETHATRDRHHPC